VTSTVPSPSTCRGAAFIDDGRPVPARALDPRELARHQLVLVRREVEAGRAGHRRMPAQCNRNPTLSREQIEEYLQAYLGVSQVIWLGKGVFNDETDGHIDNLACFVGPGEVFWMDRQQRDVQHAISLDAWERLQDARDARGAASRSTSCRCHARFRSARRKLRV